MNVIKRIIKKDFLSLRRGQFNDLLFILLISGTIGIILSYVNHFVISHFYKDQGMFRDETSLFIVLGVQTFTILIILCTQMWFLYLLRPSTWFTSEKTNFILYTKLKIKYVQVYRGKYLLNMVITSILLLIYTIFICLLHIIKKNSIYSSMNPIRLNVYSVIFMYFVWDGLLRSILFLDTIKHNIFKQRRFWIGSREGVYCLFCIIVLILSGFFIALSRHNGDELLDHFFHALGFTIVVNLSIRLFISLKLRCIDKITYQGVIYASS